MPRRDPDQPRILAELAARSRRRGGVCTAADVRAAGLSDGALRHQLESGQWQRMHRGVYLMGREPADLVTRMWGAHLALGPDSVAAAATAAQYWDLVDVDPAVQAPVSMLVPDTCRRQVPGTVVRRVPNPVARAHPARLPPVLSVENAVLDVAATSVSEKQVVEAVLRACRLRLTTPERLTATAAELPRLRRRGLVRELCAESAAGVQSPLERRYARDVARAHGLPPAARQVRASGPGGRAVYRDLLYAEARVIVELDGRLGHEDEASAVHDQLRDNDAAITGHVTLRYGWLAVVGQPCAGAGQVAQVLRSRGWAGRPRRCGAGCTIWD